MMIAAQTISDAAAKLDQHAADSARAADVAKIRAQCLAEVGQQVSRQLGRAAADELGTVEPEIAQRLLAKLDKIMVIHAKQWADTSGQCRGMAEAQKIQAKQLRELVEKAQAKVAAKKGARKTSSKKASSKKKQVESRDEKGRPIVPARNPLA